MDFHNRNQVVWLQSSESNQMGWAFLFWESVGHFLFRSAAAASWMG
jgi:hypothetical protein